MIGRRGEMYLYTHCGVRRAASVCSNGGIESKATEHRKRFPRSGKRPLVEGRITLAGECQGSPFGVMRLWVLVKVAPDVYPLRNPSRDGHDDAGTAAPNRFLTSVGVVKDDPLAVAIPLVENLNMNDTVQRSRECT